MVKARLLVVEDEALVAHDLQLTLERLGYEVLATAASGEQALDLATTQRPDLVLMDIHLAGELDGIATAARMRLEANLPVVFLTAHSDEVTFRRVQGSEPYGYVIKPFEERELEMAVSIALYRHRAETKLAQMERWLATTLRSIGDAVLATDLAGTITLMNEQAEALTGWSQAEARGRQLEDVLRLVTDEGLAPVGRLVERVLREAVVIEFGANTRLVTRDGRELPVDNSSAPIRDSAGRVSGFVIVLRDATGRKQVEDQLRYSAGHDPLTGLANRGLLMDQLRTAVERGRRRPDYQFAVLYLDLDDFKAINDQLGHGAGDQVLIGTARRLESSLRGHDTVARLGGDEFVILLDSIVDLRDAAHVAARVQQSMAAPMHVEGHEIVVGASIGMALNGPNSGPAEDMLRDADAALYRAKALGKGRNVLADAAQHQGAVALLELAADLRHAAVEGQFRLVYQPIVALAGPGAAGSGVDGAAGSARGFEALLRWQHPQRGLLLPADFLALLDEISLLAEVGDWVLRQACQQAQTWPAAAAGQEPPSVSVNLSVRQFLQTGLPEQVARALAEAGLEPGRLCLEIPQAALLGQAAAQATLARLRELGVQLQVDDFGQGLISLTELARAPLDAVKIGVGPADSAGPVRAAARLARELGLSVVAKGIERREQAEQALALGIELGQGYWLGAPA